jgi:Tfp pilus assembly protein PilF
LEQLGIAAAVAGDASRAEQYFSAAMVAGGDTKRLTERLMHICITEKRYPVAVSYAESYLVRNPKDAAIRYAMGTIYMALGETGKAIDALERSVEDKPELADAHYALASALQSRGMDPVRADEHFRTYLRLSPQGPYAENARGGLLKSVP